MSGIVGLAQLVTVCRSVDGRKRLQKMVHILQECGHPFHQQFGYLHFGPYSGEVKREIDQLVEAGLVEERETQAGEYKQYAYSPSATLPDVLQRFGVPLAPAWSSLAAELNSWSAQELEAVSTILFLRRSGFAGERLRSRFLELKPTLANLYDRTLGRANSLPVAANRNN